MSSSASTNRQLKEARKLFAKNKLESALEIVDSIIEDEPDNVNALLVRGVCRHRQKDYDGCVETLQHVIKLDENSFQAWKGLAQSYLQLNKLPECFDALIQSLLLLSKTPSGMDASQAQEIARDIFTKIRTEIHRKITKKNAKRTAQTMVDENSVAENLLELEAPPITSTPEPMKEVHYFLETLSPPVLPPDALFRLIYVRQQNLDQRLASITARSKQTLGYKGQRVVADRLAALESGHLIELLQIQIDSEDDDEIRRAAESSLLELLVSKLQFLAEGKSSDEAINNTRSKAKDLCDRMALFEPAKPIAWELAWDWDIPSLDAESYAYAGGKGNTKNKGNSLKHLKNKQQSVDSKTRLKLDGSGTPHEGDAQVEEEGEEDIGQPIASSQGNLKEEGAEAKPLSVNETVIKYPILFPNTALGGVLKAFLAPNDSFEKDKKTYQAFKGDSVFGWMLCCQFFIKHKSYEAAIDAVHNGLEAIKRRKNIFGMHMDDAVLKFKLFLATAYTHFQAPKNIGLASKLYDDILAVEPLNVEAMVGKGLIVSQQGDEQAAIPLLERVVSLNPNNEVALSELSWLLVQCGDIDRGIEGLQRCITLENPPLRNAELNFKVGYALWTKGEKEASFEKFVASLECSQNYAPAFTYLGMFFEEISGDKQRAHRCFFRAIELDNGEFIAGERLASDFAASSQWDLVEIVASTVLSSSKIKNSRNIDWPYRAMGIVCLNQLRYEEAVKYFQKCLRSNAKDVQAWTGLGDAYIHSGRYSSAEKALTRALKLEPENFSALYVLSLAQREMLDFPGSSKSLQLAIKYSRGTSVALQWALADNCLRAANYLIGESMYEQSLKEIEQALKAISSSVHAENTGILWGTAAETVILLITAGYFDPVEKRSAKQLPESIPALIRELCKKLDLPDVTDYAEIAERFSLKYVDLSSKQPKPRRVSAHAIAAQALSINGKIEGAIEHYQAGISLEPRNEDLWNSYGIIVQEKNLLVAQHCFIRALSLNGQNADTWVNLGGLYLRGRDGELALEAIDRALSLEPDHARAWIAQALAETMLDSKPNEHLWRTFEYAYLLSSNDELADIAFAMKEYEMRPEKPTSASLGALTKLLEVKPNMRDAHLIMALLLERRGDYESSLEHFMVLESWPHIARVQLSLHRHIEALESCNKIDSTSSTQYEKLSGLLTAGLAQYFLGRLDDAIESFTEALSSSSESADREEDVLRLLVEVLYASQNADARQAAQDQLFASIEENGSTLQVSLLLGAISFLEQDEVMKQAALEELKAKFTHKLHGKDLAQVCWLLDLLEPEAKSFQRAVFQCPTDYSLWRSVNKAQALIIAENQTANPLQLSQALIEAGGIENCQRATFLCPSNEDCWVALGSQIQP